MARGDGELDGIHLLTILKTEFLGGCKNWQNSFLAVDPDVVLPIDQRVEFMFLAADPLREAGEQGAGFLDELGPFGNDTIARPLRDVMPEPLVQVAHLVLVSRREPRDRGIDVRFQRWIDVPVLVRQV